MLGFYLNEPHGYLLWKGKKTAVGQSTCLAPEGIGVPLIVVSGKEAFGVVTLGQPASMTVAQFDRAEFFEQHRIKPEERRAWWPDAKTMFVYPIKSFERYPQPRPVLPVDGKSIISEVVFKDPIPVSPAAQDILSRAARLPKTIRLADCVLSLAVPDDTSPSSLGLFLDETHASLVKAHQPEIDLALQAVFEIPGDQTRYGVLPADTKHLPVYSLALVRAPRLEVEQSDRCPETPVNPQSLGEKQHTGAMIALYPDNPAVVPLPSGDDLQVTPADELHVTMVYLGTAADITPTQLQLLRGACTGLASQLPVIQATLGGTGRFTATEDDGTNAFYASVDSPAIEELRGRLVAILSALDLLPDSTHGFTAHMTLAYVPQSAPTPDLAIDKIPVTFSKLALTRAGKTESFPLLEAGEKYAPGQTRDNFGRFSGSGNLDASLADLSSDDRRMASEILSSVNPKYLKGLNGISSKPPDKGVKENPASGAWNLSNGTRVGGTYDPVKKTIHINTNGYFGKEIKEDLTHELGHHATMSTAWKKTEKAKAARLRYRELRYQKGWGGNEFIKIGLGTQAAENAEEFFAISFVLAHQGGTRFDKAYEEAIGISPGDLFK